MKPTTQADVIDYIKHDRTLTAGKNLYNRLRNKSLALQAAFNRFYGSPENIRKVCYELCKATGLQERQFTVLMNAPVVPKEAEPEKLEVVEDEEVSLEKRILVIGAGSSSEEIVSLAKKLLDTETVDSTVITVPEFEGGLKGVAARKNFLKDQDWEHSARSIADLDQEIEAWKASSNEQKLAELKEFVLKKRDALIAEKTAEMPIDVKQKIRLWQQFPFLREKDCPDVFKILVNDMITAYHDYMKEQPKLHEALTDADRKAITDSVKENFTLNKQIWAELEHYQNHGEILGEHPIFERQREEEAITALETPDLVKKIETLDRNVKRNTKKSQDEKKDQEDRDHNAELAAKQQELLDFANAELAKRK